MLLSGTKLQNFVGKIIRGRIQTGTPGAKVPRRRTPREVNIPKDPQVLDNREPDSDLEDQYTPKAKQLEQRLGELIPTRTDFHHANFLEHKRFYNTKSHVIVADLQELGVYHDFKGITERACIQTKFWEIDTPVYKPWTIEFLSSFCMLEDANEEAYLKFRLGDGVGRLYFSDLIKMFGFDANPKMSPNSFRGDLDKSGFWRLLTWIEGPVKRSKWWSNLIQHPVLHILHQILYYIIFAREESFSKANIEELALMDAMLRPDDNFQVPDILETMLMHWCSVRDNTKEGGYITMGPYVAYIAKKLRIPSPNPDDCSNTTTLINAMTFEKGQFITIIEQPAPGQPKYFWTIPNREHVVMPMNILFELSNPSTWLVLIDTTLAHSRVPSLPSHERPRTRQSTATTSSGPSTSAQHTWPYSPQPQPYQAPPEPQCPHASWYDNIIQR